MTDDPSLIAISAPHAAIGQDDVVSSSTDAPSRRRPVGRRPGDPDDTRACILDAARQLFAGRGFERATIRAIAELAEVDPALVIHHFTNKQKLFTAAHRLPFEMSEVVTSIGETPASERGEFIARLYLSLMAAPASPALSMVRAAATNDTAARMLNEFITDALLAHADVLAPGDDGRRRLALAGAQLIGVVVGREILGLEPLRSASVDELVAHVAPVIQTYLDGTDR